MAGVSFTVAIDDAEVQAGLRRALATAEDLTPALDEIGSMLAASTQLRFERSAGPDGRTWPPSLRAAAAGGLTLVDSGRLKDSIVHRAGAQSVEVGTNVVYAAIHQLGGTIEAKNAPYLTFRIGDRWASKKSVTIPARPFLGIDDGDRREILAILRDHIAESFAA